MTGPGASAPGGPWAALGASARGAAHAARNLPNQDAWGTWPPPAGDGAGDGAGAVPVRILVVADGHGDPRCCRAGAGAALAVRAALGTLAGLLPCEERAVPTLLLALPDLLVDAWRALVDRDLLDAPLLPAELALALGGRGRAGDTPASSAGPRLAYGSTLLLVAACPGLCLVAQLGDGDILRVEGDGSVSRALPRDPTLLGDLTTSLCDGQAALSCRVAALGGPPPALLILATDGVANSFADDDGFLKVGRDLLALCRDRGIGGAASRLPALLLHLSAAGSGDDATLAALASLADPAPPVDLAPPAPGSPGAGGAA